MDDDDRKRFASWRESETALIRDEGVKALVHFGSVENVANLRTMLDDPA